MKQRFTVYMAGPITGLAYADATDWRAHVKQKLSDAGIHALSPLRAKEYLKDVTSFSADGDVYASLSSLSTNRGITTRDRYDAMRCDVLLVNLLGATSVSIGTVMEIAWADACRIPIVVAMEAEGNIHDHGMLNEVTGFRVSNLPEAVHIVKAIADAAR